MYWLRTLGLSTGDFKMHKKIARVTFPLWLVCGSNRCDSLSNDFSILSTMKKRTFILVVAALFFMLPMDAQCAMCRAVLESEEGGEMAKGVNNGIKYLMIFPYLLVGGIGYIIYRSRKKSKEEDEQL